MQTDNRLFDDLAKLATNALGTLQSMTGEAQQAFRQQLEKLLLDMDFVRREEFEAVKEMAANARAENERLSRRLAELEAREQTPATD